MSHNPQIDQATAMMVAADRLQRPGRYNFNQMLAEHCETHGGCPLAWIAYIQGAGMDQDACRWLGYDSVSDFFAAMADATGTPNWWRTATLAAHGLRRLARERMSQ